MRNKFSYKLGFSLVEVLITLLIAGFLMVALAPAITKGAIKKGVQSVVFTYNPTNRISSDNLCFQAGVGTRVNSSTNNYISTEKYDSTRDCSQYTFTVPDGVTHVNLTLVAGGGGGGGAAGGTVEKTFENTLGPYWNSWYNWESSYTTEIGQLFFSNLKISELISSVVINLLTTAGETGGDIDTYTSGTGGDSSPAIVDYKVPIEYMRGFNYSPALRYADITNTHFLYIISRDSDNTETSWDGSDAIYIGSGTNLLSRANSYTFEIGHKNSAYYCHIFNSSSGEDNSQDCSELISDKNYKESVEGTSGNTFSSTATLAINDYLPGGTGGAIPAAGNYGFGANGNQIKVATCGSGSNVYSCKRTKATFYAPITYPPGKSHISLTYTVEHPGGPGSGGAAGAVARIIGFPVNAGDTYTVYVGKGGSGGNKGVSAEDPTAGEDGTGGVSTAIYDSNNNLVFMVNGGVFGAGGYTYNTKYTGGMGYPARHYLKLISSANYYTYRNNADSDLTAVGSSHGSTTKFDNGTNSTTISSTYVRFLTYPLLAAEPYSTFRRNGAATTNYYSGYTYFNTIDGVNEGYKNSTTGPQTQTINDTTIYDGFYARTVLGNEIGYVGGLGGFNGFGGKAGCGGYFMGNADGLEDDFSTKNNAYAGKFIIDGTAYSVSDYFDNCTSQTSDGQSADFVMPKVTASEISYGQAGAGGGGGGYSLTHGPGNGGDGQNGYLMIDWRK